MNFMITYSNTSDQLKLKFLDAIIKENEELQEAFINFAGQESNTYPGLPYKGFSELVKRTNKEYIKFFESVDPENPDWDNYHPPHNGYVEEWEQYQMASEQEFEKIFKNFNSMAVDKIIQQKIDL